MTLASLTQEAAAVPVALFTLTHQCIRSRVVYSRCLRRYIAYEDEGDGDLRSPHEDEAQRQSYPNVGALHQRYLH